MKTGADVNAAACHDGRRTALQAAAGSPLGNIIIVQVLLDTGANVNAAAVQLRGLTTLQDPAIRTHIGITMKFLEYGTY